MEGNVVWAHVPKLPIWPAIVLGSDEFDSVANLEEMNSVDSSTYCAVQLFNRVKTKKIVRRTRVYNFRGHLIFVRDAWPKYIEEVFDGVRDAIRCGNNQDIAQTLQEWNKIAPTVTLSEGKKGEKPKPRTMSLPLAPAPEVIVMEDDSSSEPSIRRKPVKRKAPNATRNIRKADRSPAATPSDVGLESPIHNGNDGASKAGPSPESPSAAAGGKLPSSDGSRAAERTSPSLKSPSRNNAVKVLPNLSLKSPNPYRKMPKTSILESSSRKLAPVFGPKPEPELASTLPEKGNRAAPPAPPTAAALFPGPIRPPTVPAAQATALVSRGAPSTSVPAPQPMNSSAKPVSGEFDAPHNAKPCVKNVDAAVNKANLLLQSISANMKSFTQHNDMQKREFMAHEVKKQTMQGLATKKSQAHMERKRALAGHEKRENEFTATKKKVLDDSNRLSEKLEKQRESIIALRHQYRHLAALIQGLEADVNQSTNALAMLRGSLLTFNRNRTGQSDKKEAKEEYSRAETAIVPLFILFFRQPV